MNFHEIINKLYLSMLPITDDRLNSTDGDLAKTIDRVKFSLDLATEEEWSDKERASILIEVMAEISCRLANDHSELVKELGEKFGAAERREK